MAGSAFAQQQASAKVTAKTANFTLLPKTTTSGDWVTLLSNVIKVPNQKDLFIGASLEVGLYTDTQAKSKNMVPDTSTAVAEVKVRVLIDGNEASPVEPGEVVFGRRSQTLSATLEGAISGCLSIVTNLDGSLSIVVDPNCVTPEVIQVILDTTDAASFNFVAVDVPVGVHTISVQAKVSLNTQYQTGSAEASALVGKGSMTVESVRLIKNEDVVANPPEVD